MKIRSKLLLSNLVVILIVVSISVFFVFQLIGIQKLINKEFPNAIQIISNESYLDSLAQFFRYYDEILTQSARNYAFTGELKWKDRYFTVANDLDLKIKEAITKGGVEEKKFFDMVNASNNALIALEEKSFVLVELGNKKGAVDILDSKEYSDLKTVYTGALTSYVSLRGQKYQNALTVSTASVQSVAKNLSNTIFKIVWIFILGILAGIIVVVIFIVYFSKKFVEPLYEIKSATKIIIAGNFDKKIVVNSNDEFEELADSFNAMTDKLKQKTEGVEQKVKERTKDLETLNKYMVGRELKMIELKKRIVELENKIKN